MIKLHSWNVNGIRACIKKGFLDYVENYKPDVICLQETRGQPDENPKSSSKKAEPPSPFLPDYHKIWNHAEKKGYSGTSIFVKKSRKKALQIQADFFGMGKAEHDKEGRITGMEFPDFRLLSVYTPNAGDGLRRLDYRQKWDKDFRNFCRKLAKDKPLIICGDLNVAHTEIDLANPKTNRRNAGFTDEEREGFTKLLEAGFVDTFRMFTKEGGHYTWWSYRSNARTRNIGWRIDYFCVSEDFRSRVRASNILPEVYGSDHCPVELIL